ncbi:MAG: 30S ribosome-binding factor RbfA [Candidatus Omnitrophica bacterium]|nr:30S ribosome-binding factor RbfA [Candidatus Omnitrophota bacterium]
MSVRMDKVNKEIMKQLTEILQREMDDPALEMLSVTRVDTTADLRESRIYFSLLNEKQYSHAEEALARMKKFIRAELGKRLYLKILPELKFFPDDSIQYSVNIFQKTEQLRREREDKERNKESHRDDPAQ